MSSNIEYLKGDATQPKTAGNKFIAHVCNDIGGWGAGFVVALSRRWPEPEAAYREWFRIQQPTFALGEVQLVQVEDDLWVANMIGQRSIKGRSEGPPIRYEAIEDALEKLALLAQEKSASVHMPRIGCGLAGGKWERIEPLIQKTLCAKDLQVFVYDFG